MTAPVSGHTGYQFIAYLETANVSRYYYLTVQAGGSNAYLGGPTGTAHKTHGLWEVPSMTYTKGGVTVPVVCPHLIARPNIKKHEWIESAPRSCFKHLTFRYNLSGQQRRQVYVTAGGSETFYDDFCHASECLT